MKILVEIDLLDIEPNDVYNPNSGWFNEPGCIDINSDYLDWIQDPGGSVTGYRFKYIGQVHEGDIPRIWVN